MGGGGKGGGGAKTYDYYASLAGWICEGPVAELVAVVSDQRIVWPKAKEWVAGSYAPSAIVFYQGRLYTTGTTTSAVPPASPWTPYALTSASANGSGFTALSIEGLGTVRFYWGLDSQTADPLLSNVAKTLVDGVASGHAHPPYRGICYAVLDDCLLGRERAAAPNLRFVVRRVPKQTLLSGGPAVLDDTQANAVAVLAEVMTNGRAGLGLANAALDATSWQAAADALHTERARAALSPVLGSRQTVRQVVSELGGYTDAWLRFNASSGKIEAGLWIHGSAPGSATVLGPDQWQAVPQLKVSTWAQASTQAVVQFADRENLYKQVPEPVTDLRARRIVGEDRPATVSRPYITRRPQARALGAEWLRSRGRPPAVVTLRVRRSIGLTIRPGDWVRPDLDPEPGGSQTLVYAKVIGRTIPALKDGSMGDVSLDCEVDETLAPLLYTPAADEPVFAQPTPPAGITAFRLLEAPAALAAGALGRVMVLAQRPTATHVGMELWFDSALDADSDFDRVGRQPFFAVKANLVANLAADALSNADELTIDPTPANSVLRLQVPSQVDDRLFNGAPPGVIAANNDTLLLVLIETASGAVAEDSFGAAKVEILSVVEWQVYGPNTPPTYAIRARRRRSGTEPLAFTAAAAEAWIIRREALALIAHADFGVLKRNRELNLSGPQDGTFRIQPVSVQAARPLADCADITFAWPKDSPGRPRLAWEAPGQTSWPYTFATSAGGNLRLVGRWTDADGNLVSIGLTYRIGSGAEIPVFSRTLTNQGDVVFDVTLSLTAPGTTYTITARALDAAGLTRSSSVTATVPPASGSKVAAPYFDPPPDSYPGTSIGVTIYTATAGADISYKLGGTSEDPGTPTPGSNGWSALAAAPLAVGPFTIARKITAVAVKAGLTDSDLAVGIYGREPGAPPGGFLP